MRELSLDEQKLLRRLKLSLWLITVLFVVHGMMPQFPEIYPITRWAMFSEARPKVLRQGDFIFYELQAHAANGETYHVTQDNYFSGLRLTSAAGNMAFIAMHFASQVEEPDRQAEYARSLFERLEDTYGIPMTQVDVWRFYYPIDYERFPAWNPNKPDERRLVARLSENGTRIEVIKDARERKPR